MVKCQVVLEAMEQIASRRLAEEWDNVGLLLGSPAQPVQKIFVCLDVSEAVVDRAVAEGYDMIVSHHPFIFRAMKCIRTDLPLGRMLQKLMKNNIAVYAAHTNLDIATGGVNDVLAGLIGLVDLQPFEVMQTEELMKLVVFVPRDYARAVREAIGREDAGHIGSYSHCSFTTAGQGEFLPLEGTHPFIGQQRKLETVEEVRVETIVSAKLQKRVVKAMLAAHPYEEVGYDLYPLKNEGKIESMGRVGILPKAITIEELAIKLRDVLPTEHVRFVKSGERLVKKIALCSGSGAEFISKAFFSGADAYVTGDVKYHDAQRAVELGIHVVDGGHFGTEMPAVKVLGNRLREELSKVKGLVEIGVDNRSKDFFTVI